MISQEVQNYIEQLIPKRDIRIQKIEEYAKEHGVPIMELVGIEVLLQQLRMIKPERILEVGTAIGYSAIRMAETLPAASIVTIERDTERYKQALHNIKEFDLADRIEVLFGDANELVPEAGKKGPYDVIFIDAAKGQYQRFFESYGEFLRRGGIIFSDNILFKGYVADDAPKGTRRLTSLIRKIRSYNEYLMNHTGYTTAILPVGDGLGISIKKDNEQR
ncbi:O-methyltransferase [Fictibacillus fluitans]|uniref:tRNA 5-hydroxyuridine methyltransferase n=1 Tax=Fictibacillus fluitans TaxID=3058422 RepID=A0ABT8HZW3_9BACL|nr:O-methyltransferase [Fictibacillus sp. NE201]MDN4526291.1 O-methyltransferase [Fictibacillus sp. NE201]